jgi:uncharacterized membrane protein
VIIGAPLAYMVVKGWLDPQAWMGYATLAGSWIGGTGNMAAVAEGIKTPGTEFGLAVVADNVVYLIWLPILLQSKNMAKWFHKFTRLPAANLDKLKEAAKELHLEKEPLAMRHLIYLTAIGFGGAWIAGQVASVIPQAPPVFTTSTYSILLVSAFGIALSFTKARMIPGSHELAMALVYLFVSRMGAKTVIAGLVDQAVPFVAGAYIWIFIHGAFLLFAARLFRVDVHTAAIASAANIGGAASAPIVASFHDERLVPVAILMALVGYAVGTAAAFGTAWLCHQVSLI